MAFWLFFFAEYTFKVSTKQNISSGALSCRPEYELTHAITLSSPNEELIRMAYPRDSMCGIISLPWGVRSIKDRTPLFRRGCVPVHIYIPSVIVFCTIAQMQRMPLALLCLTIRIQKIVCSLRSMILPSVVIWVMKRLKRVCDSPPLVTQTLQMGTHICAYMRNVQAGQSLSTFGWVAR